MSFKILVNGKELPNTKIQWKFIDHPTNFQSDPERFLRNVAFWQQKLGLPKDAAYEILNGELKTIETNDVLNILLKEKQKDLSHLNDIKEKIEAVK